MRPQLLAIPASAHRSLIHLARARTRRLAAFAAFRRDRSRRSLPDLTASLADDDCPIEPAERIDDRLGEMS